MLDYLLIQHVLKSSRTNGTVLPVVNLFDRLSMFKLSYRRDATIRKIASLHPVPLTASINLCFADDATLFIPFCNKSRWRRVYREIGRQQSDSYGNKKQAN